MFSCVSHPVLSVALGLIWFFTALVFPPGEAWAGWKWHQPHGRGAGDHVRAGAEPAPPGALQGRDPAAQTEETHPEEPRLRRQLPGQAGHPEGGAGEAEGAAAAGGGQTGQRERVHAHRTGRPEVQVRSLADLRQDCGAEPHSRGRGEGRERWGRRGAVVGHRPAHTGEGGDGDERHHDSQVKDGRAVLRGRRLEEGVTGWSSAASE